MNETLLFSQELPSEEATAELARRLAPELVASDLVILTGPLGAGKTFFTRELCHELGLDEAEPVTSPTFTLIHEYPTRPPLCHVDLYRLSSEDEVEELGLSSLREEGRLLVVEWGAPYARLLGGDAIELQFEVFPRRVVIRGTSQRARALVRRLCDGADGPEQMA